MDFQLENDLHACLNKDEKLLWSGRPQTGIKLRPADAYLIPFTVAWCGFAVFWETTAFASNAPFFFRLWGIPFVAVGVYMVIGRFFADALRRKNTSYGLTDNRVIIISGIISKEIKSLPLKTMTDVTVTEKSDGSGTIMLGPGFYKSSLFNNIGSMPNVKAAPSIEFIDDVRKVYQLLTELQGK